MTLPAFLLNGELKRILRRHFKDFLKGKSGFFLDGDSKAFLLLNIGVNSVSGLRVCNLIYGIGLTGSLPLLNG